MLVHGVSTDGNPVQITQVNQMITQANGGRLAGMADSVTVRDLETIKLARMLQMHSETFDMPLPETPEPVVKKDVEKLPDKGNGKLM
jgi:hypothetical protein